jgi:queuine/archaeosine tRNA-ribosyltransferase
VQEKVEETAKFGRLFYLEMPDELKPKAMGVVQGHNLAQVDLCLSAYLKLGLKHIGFGSFGTIGKNSQTNVATENAVMLAQYVSKIAKEHAIRIHFFGLGAPALVAMISGAGANSFDSSSWLKSAGFGQIFLPFTRSYNICHRNASAEMHKGITVSDFKILRAFTKHGCPFCDDIKNLQAHKLYRAMHNLICVKETVDRLNNRDFDLIKKIYANGSPKYQQEYEKWLLPV